MLEFINKFYLFTKEYIKTKSFIAYVLLLCGSVFITHNIEACFGDEYKAGVYVAKDNNFNTALENLVLENGTFSSYDSQYRLENDIKSGVITCGFIIDGEIKEYDFNEGSGYTIGFLSDVKTKEAESFKELFYGCFLKLYNDEMIPDIVDEVFEGVDNNLVEEVIERKNGYLGSDSLFRINIIGNETAAYSKDVYKGLVRGIIAICVFMAVLFRGYSSFDGYISVVFDVIPKDRRFIYSFGYLLSAGICTGTVGFLVQIIENGFAFIFVDLVKMIMMIIYSVIWTMLVGTVIKNKKIYYQFCVLTLPFMLIICPVIIKTGIYIKAFDTLKYIFPISLYL